MPSEKIELPPGDWIDDWGDPLPFWLGLVIFAALAVFVAVVYGL